MKRVRKKDSALLLASQNIEDFALPGIAEMTKPLFSIPTHQFLFNAGQINPKDFMDALSRLLVSMRPFTPKHRNLSSTILVCPLKYLDSAPTHMEWMPRHTSWSISSV